MNAHHQALMARSLLDPTLSIDGLVDPPRRDWTVGARFDVHRNNVVQSLVEALKEGFPSVERLVGEEFFSAMAVEYATKHPPKSPVMFAYGAEFPDFLRGFEPVQELVYLADVALLDGLRRRAWHASDSRAIYASDLAQLDALEVELLEIQCVPSLGVISSSHPAVSIWRIQNGDDVPLPAGWPQENAVVFRGGDGIHVEDVGADVVAFLIKVGKGAGLMGLFGQRQDAMGRVLSECLSRGWIQVRGSDAEDLFSDFLPRDWNTSP